MTVSIYDARKPKYFAGFSHNGDEVRFLRVMIKLC